MTQTRKPTKRDTARVDFATAATLLAAAILNLMQQMIELFHLGLGDTAPHLR